MMKNQNNDRLVKKGSRLFTKQYIAKKHSKEINKPKSKLFILLLILVGVFSVLYNLYTHPFMKISDIYINGNVKVDDSEIMKKIKSPLGENILFYNPLKYEKDIESINYIRKAKVRKVFPKILSIKVEEDFPLFKDTYRGKDYYISNNALIVDENKIDENDKKHLIKIEAGPIQDVVGESFTSSKASREFISEISKFAYIGMVSQLNLENKTDIGIMIKDIEVKFGDLNNISYKLKLLEEILKDVNKKGQKVTTINLNNGDNPLVVVD